MTAPAGIYPFATADGKAIPLDIIKPKAIIAKSFVLEAAAAVTIPEDALVGFLFSDVACFVRFGATLPHPIVDGTEYSDTVLVPVGSIVTVSLTAGTAYVKGLTAAGTLYIQVVEKWAGLALDRQYTTKG